MIEVNTIKTNIAIPRSALPDNIEIDNIGVNLLTATADAGINKSKYLPITIEEGIAYSNYFYINTGLTFNNIANNEPTLYYLIVFRKDKPEEIFYTVPVRWCGRLNGNIKNSVHDTNNYLDIKQQKPIKYFE